MKNGVLGGPQQTILFRAVALFSRFRFSYLYRSTGQKQWPLVLFVLITGSVALAIISAAAWLTKLPLLFPPLGPSAFILFYTPMSVQASPRSVFLSHSIALASGFAALGLLHLFYPEAGLFSGTEIGLPRIFATALAMALVSVGMILARCAHPPAAATALIVATGFLNEPVQALGLLGAVFLLILEAIFFIRLQAGLPYPLWRSDPEISRHYGSLAGIPQSGTSFWQQLMVGAVFSNRHRGR